MSLGRFPARSGRGVIGGGRTPCRIRCPESIRWRHAELNQSVPPARDRIAELLEDDLSEAVRVLRTARADHSDVDLVSMRTLVLTVFRARHRGAEEDVVLLNQLKLEIIPE